MRPVESLMRLSPSTSTTSRRGARTRVAISTAATGSVGETTAPSTNAASHDRPSMTACATTATTTIVAVTSATARNEIGPRFARRSCSDEKNAAEYSSGGRKARRTMSGSSTIWLRPGMEASALPPATIRIGYGIGVLAATTRNAPAATSTARTTNSPRIASFPPLGRRQRRHGQRGDALASPDEPEALARRGLHVHLPDADAQPGGERCPDRVAVRRELRPLHDHRAV